MAYDETMKLNTNWENFGYNSKVKLDLTGARLMYIIPVSTYAVETFMLINSLETKIRVY